LVAITRVLTELLVNPMTSIVPAATSRRSQGRAWPLNIGQVYSTLQRLERDGLIVSEEPDGAEGPERRRYRLTEHGSEELDSWFASSLPRPAHWRSELVVKVAVAMTLPDVDVRSVLDAQRAVTMSNLQALTQSKARVKAGGDLVASLRLTRWSSTRRRRSGG